MRGLYKYEGRAVKFVDAVKNGKTSQLSYDDLKSIVAGAPPDKTLVDEILRCQDISIRDILHIDGSRFVPPGHLQVYEGMRRQDLDNLYVFRNMGLADIKEPAVVSGVPYFEHHLLNASGKRVGLPTNFNGCIISPDEAEGITDVYIVVLEKLKDKNYKWIFETVFCINPVDNSEIVFGESFLRLGSYMNLLERMGFKDPSAIDNFDLMEDIADKGPDRPVILVSEMDSRVIKSYGSPKRMHKYIAESGMF